MEAGSKMTVSTRIWTSKILGPASCKIESSQFTAHILKKVTLLSQDTDSEVRLSMCGSLNKIVLKCKYAFM